MEARKVLVNESDEAVISCPACSLVKKMSVGRYRKDSKRYLRVKCSCSKVFNLCLEYREYYRKSVKLLGKSINLSNHRETQDIIVKNVSLRGVGFCPFKKHRTRQGDRLQVFFELNDGYNSPIRTDVIVRRVEENYLGCEFINALKIREPLGFYLLR